MMKPYKLTLSLRIEPSDPPHSSWGMEGMTLEDRQVIAADGFDALVGIIARFHKLTDEIRTA